MGHARCCARGEQNEQERCALSARYFHGRRMHKCEPVARRISKYSPEEHSPMGVAVTCRGGVPRVVMWAS